MNEKIRNSEVRQCRILIIAHRLALRLFSLRGDLTFRLESDPCIETKHSCRVWMEYGLRRVHDSVYNEMRFLMPPPPPNQQDFMNSTRPSTVPQMAVPGHILPHSGYTLSSESTHINIPATHHHPLANAYPLMRPSLGMAPHMPMTNLTPGKARTTPPADALGPPMFMPCELPVKGKGWLGFPW